MSHQWYKEASEWNVNNCRRLNLNMTQNRMFKSRIETPIFFFESIWYICHYVLHLSFAAKHFFFISRKF